MAVKATKKGRGRPRGELRNWYSKNLPKVKPAKSGGDKEVTLEHPEHGEITITLPRNYVPIPPDLTDGKSQANVGQTARNEAKEMGLDTPFIVHEIPVTFEGEKEADEFNLFALEAK